MLYPLLKIFWSGSGDLFSWLSFISEFFDWNQIKISWHNYFFSWYVSKMACVLVSMHLKPCVKKLLQTDNDTISCTWWWYCKEHNLSFTSSCCICFMMVRQKQLYKMGCMHMFGFIKNRIGLGSYIQWTDKIDIIALAKSLKKCLWHQCIFLIQVYVGLLGQTTFSLDNGTFPKKYKTENSTLQWQCQSLQ